MKKRDALGDRMKLYEGIESNRTLIPNLPIIARLDGRSFSSFTKGLNRPFDESFSNLMISTTVFLVEESRAKIGYTQSDEITLVFLYEPTEEPFFGGRIQKINSILAGLATGFFNRKVDKYLPSKKNKFAQFDCRIWNVPSLMEAYNCLLWREQDATKNSVNMAAREFYSHKELFKKNEKEQQEMLWKKGINWNNYPNHFKKGTYFKKCKELIKFSANELEKLPKHHNARKNPNLLFERSEVKELKIVPLRQLINPLEVLFDVKN